MFEEYKFEPRGDFFVFEERNVTPCLGTLGEWEKVCDAIMTNDSVWFSRVAYIPPTADQGGGKLMCPCNAVGGNYDFYIILTPEKAEFVAWIRAGLQKAKDLVGASGGD